MGVGRAIFVVSAGLLCAFVASGASGTLVPSGLSPFSASAGSNTSQTQTLTVTANPSSVTLNFSAQATTFSGGGWLSVSPAQNTTSPTSQASLTVTANPSGLPAGTFSGTITLTCDDGSSCPTVMISVSLQIQGVTLIPSTPPTVMVTAGQAATANITLATTSSSSFTVNVSILTGGNFLQAPASATAPGVLTVNITTTGLSAGTYNGSVYLQCVSCTPATVPITVDVTAAATLTTGMLSSSLTGIAGQSLTQCGAGCTSTFTLSASSGTLNFQIAASSNGGWLAVNPASGTATAAGTPITVTATPASLTANSYTGMLTISCVTPSSCSSVQVSVGFSVNAVAAGPSITSITPSSAAAGSPSLAVKIIGSGFVSGANAQWNGLSLSTTFMSATTLSAQITAGDLLNPGTGQITVQNPNGIVSNSVPFQVTSGSALQLITVAPCRVLDTRTPANDGSFPANSTFGSPDIAAGSVRTVPIPQGVCNVPANALAYSLNFTVQPRTTNPGYLTVWPTGSAQPNTSTVNFSNPAVVLAAAGILGAGANASINASATADIDLIIDINGYFVPPGAGTLQFYPLAPCRVLDTRTPANGGTFPANSTFGSPSLDGVNPRAFPIPSSACGVPPNAAAYSFNVGVVPQGALYFLAAYPTGGSLPVVSTMNSFDGTILANAAIVPAGTGGAVNFFASNPTDFFVDINGYFAPPGSGGLNFYTLSPCRLVDTRNAGGTFGGPTMTADAIRSFPLPQTPCGIPNAPSVQAYSVGITVYPVGGPLSYLTTWPTGQPQPFVSTLNAFKGLPIANAALVPAGSGGAISVFVTNTTDVTIDTAGYFGP